MAILRNRTPTFNWQQKGVAAGLSASKWVRMTKVSKPTATRDLAELAKTGGYFVREEK